MLSKIEISYFLKLFIRQGYVLDFSTNSFDIFTTSSIEIPLCEKYELPKGKSLSAFCTEDSPEKVQKLLFDLLDYYETHYKYRTSEEENRGIFEKCLSIRDREQENVKIEVPALTCVNVEYISNISKRAINDIENGEFDSAITKARTLFTFFKPSFSGSFSIFAIGTFITKAMAPPIMKGCSRFTNTSCPDLSGILYFKGIINVKL